MANCSDSTYVIYYTDASKGTIQIAKSVLDVNRLDIALIGKTRIEYGEIFNENLLHLLENFAAPSLNGAHNIPDTSITNAALLERPTIGQFWYNSNFKNMYVRSPDNAVGFWKGLHSRNSLFGISGTVEHGQIIPLPNWVRPSDCSFSVSPFFYQNSNLRSFNVSVDSTGLVTALYVNVAGSAIPGTANYMALVVFNNTNNGTSDVCDTAPPMVSPTATVTPSSSLGVTPASPTPTPTPTVTPSVTATPATTSSPTPTPAPGASPTPAPSATPQPSPTNSPSPAAITQTPQASVTPTPQASLTPQASVTPTPQASVTPTPTATVTPSPVAPTNISGSFVSFSSFSMPLDFPFNSGQARLTFNTDYTVTTGTSDTPDAVIGGPWLTGTPGNAADFRLRYDVTNYDPPTVNAAQLIGSAPATWHTGSMSIIMEADNPQIMGGTAGDPGTIEFNITIQRISNPADQVIVPGSISVTSGII